MTKPSNSEHILRHILIPGYLDDRLRQLAKVFGQRVEDIMSTLVAAEIMKRWLREMDS